MAISKTHDVTSTPSVNWSSFLEQLIRDYETEPAKGLAHGLQKDAIQNGWGARHGKKQFKFEIVLLKKAAPNILLTLTDSGTVGLIGDVLDPKKLPERIPAHQRLARFESMFDSGGQSGPGLFGRGKLIFNAGSSKRSIYYDSLTKDGDYRFGFRQIEGRSFHQFERILENDAAKKELAKRTGGALKPLENTGTRITIVNPRKEIIDYIESGDFLRAIEETWWEIIKKHDVNISVRIDEGNPTIANVPSDYGALPIHNEKGWRVYYQENIPLEVDKRSYRIKRLHFLIPPPSHKIRPDLLGVSIHRKGMKVGEVRLSALPKEIEDRFFGYVELEPEFEDLIAALENLTHYGFASLHKAAYRNLKREIQTSFDVFMEKLGLNKKGKDPEEEMRRLLEDAQAELNSILRDLGVPNLGTGREPKGEFFISVEDLEFPEGSNYVSTGDRIGGFWFLIKNLTNAPKSGWLEIYTYERDVDVIETFQSRQRIDFAEKGEHKTKPFTIDIVSSLYPSRKKIACICRITDSDKKELARKAFYFHVDLELEVEIQHAVIRLISAKWPRAVSRRVDFGESITDLCYEIENLSARRMKARVRLRTLWAAEGNTPIDDKLGTWDIELTPFQSLEVVAERVTASKEKYEEIDRGKINLRCHAIALEKTRGWEKGARLAEHTVSFFLNTDPSQGFFDAPEYFEGGAEGARSESQPLVGRAWKFRLNSTHPAYQATENDPDHRKDYLFQEMAKQTVYVLVRTDQFSVLQKQLGLDGVRSLSDLQQEDLLDRVAYRFTDKVLASYYIG